MKYSKSSSQFIVTNTYIKKKQEKTSNKLTLHFKELEKEEHMKPKLVKGRK